MTTQNATYQYNQGTNGDLFFSMEPCYGKRAKTKKKYEERDHLGSVRVVVSDQKNADSTAKILNYNNYYAFGMKRPGVGQSFNLQTGLDNSTGYRYGYNGMEQDFSFHNADGESYDFGARIYDPRLGRWMAIDPKAIKYPGLSPYHFGYNSPIITIDPNGEENIVIVGGEYDGKRFKYNFVEPAIKQLKAYRMAEFNEKTTLAVMNVGYSESDIQELQNVARNNGANFVLLNNAEELTNYLNSQGTGSSGLSDARTSDKITNAAVFGHGFTGSLEFGFNQDKDGTTKLQDKFSFGIDDVENLSAEAFDKATLEIYTCNCATNFKEGNLAKSLSAKIEGTVVAFEGRTDYAEINTQRSFFERASSALRRRRTGFDPDGSRDLPISGKKADGSPAEQRTYVNGTEAK